MTRHYFSQPIDVKPAGTPVSAQRITVYHVRIDGKRHDVPATHRDMLQILRLMMDQPSQNAEVRNA